MCAVREKSYLLSVTSVICGWYLLSVSGTNQLPFPRKSKNTSAKVQHFSSKSKFFPKYFCTFAVKTAKLLRLGKIKLRFTVLEIYTIFIHPFFCLFILPMVTPLIFCFLFLPFVLCLFYYFRNRMIYGPVLLPEHDNDGILYGGQLLSQLPDSLLRS